MKKEDTLNHSEIFTMWTQLSLNYGFIAANQSFFKHTRDKDLTKMINEAIQCLMDENKKLEQILIMHKMSLPSATAPLPDVQISSITTVAKVNDSEISASLSMNIATGLVSTSQAMDISTKDYIFKMYGVHHMKKAILGAKLLHLSQRKGWLPAPATNAAY
ncbi:MAG: DUF3231 family protein [Lysinibacillus sp.]